MEEEGLVGYQGGGRVVQRANKTQVRGKRPPETPYYFSRLAKIILDVDLGSRDFGQRERIESLLNLAIQQLIFYPPKATWRVNTLLARLERRDPSKGWTEFRGGLVRPRKLLVDLTQFGHETGFERQLWRSRGERKKHLFPDDPFMGIFFVGEGSLLKNLAYHLTDVSPEEMGVYFARRSVSLSLDRDYGRLGTSLMKMNTENDWRANGLRYSGVMEGYSRYTRYCLDEEKMRWAQKQTICFAEVKRGEKSLLRASFIPNEGDRRFYFYKGGGIVPPRGSFVFEWAGLPVMTQKNKISLLKRVVNESLAASLKEAAAFS